MKKQICSSFLMILIVGGMAMSVLNFSTKAYASRRGDDIWGTTTRIESILLQSMATRQGRHLFRDYYCVDDPSTCVVVFEN